MQKQPHCSVKAIGLHCKSYAITKHLTSNGSMQFCDMLIIKWLRKTKIPCDI